MSHAVGPGRCHFHNMASLAYPRCSISNKHTHSVLLLYHTTRWLGTSSNACHGFTYHCSLFTSVMHNHPSLLHRHSFFQSIFFLYYPSIPFLAFLQPHTSHVRSHSLSSLPTGPPPFPPDVQVTSTHTAPVKQPILVTPVLLFLKLKKYYQCTKLYYVSGFSRVVMATRTLPPYSLQLIEGDKRDRVRDLESPILYTLLQKDKAHRDGRVLSP